MSATTAKDTMKAAWEALRRQAGWTAVLSGAMLAVLAAWTLWLRDLGSSAMTGVSIGGGALLYGLPGNEILDFMPLAEVIQGLIDSTVGCLPHIMVPLMTALLVVAGAMTTERPARPTALTILAAAIFWLPYTALVSTYDTEQFLYGSTILLFALALAEEDGTAKSRWRIGTAFSLCICVRSPMLPFLPLLLLWRLAWRGGWRKPIIFMKEEALPLLGPAAAVLCLWSGISLAATGRISPPEGMRAVSNLISGAMGFVGTMEGNYRQLAGISQESNPYFWALGHILENPLPYLRAIPLRALVAFNVAPVTSCVAIAGMVLFRSIPFYRTAGVITLYFLCVHCAMSVEGRYFSALLPLVSTVALAALFRLSGVIAYLKPEESPARKVSRHAINAVEFTLYALLALGLGLAALYPFRTKGWTAVPKSPPFPESGYFHAFWGTKAMMGKNYPAAADSYRQAAKLLPLRGHEKEFLWASILAGKRKLLSARTMDILGRDTPRDALVLVAFAAGENRQACKAALNFWLQNVSATHWFFRGDGKGGFNRSEQEGMRRAKTLFTRGAEMDMRALAETLSESRRKVLLSAMADVKIPTSSEVWLIARITSDKYFERASARKNAVEAIADIILAVEAGSNDQYVLVRAGAAAFGLHANTKAEKWLLAAYRLDNKNKDAALSLINFYVLTGKHKLAKQYCLQARANGLFSDQQIADSCR